MRRPLRLLAGALLVAWAVVATEPASAATLEHSAWWYRLAPAPPPPGIPEDGLYVQGTPEGATAIAAVSYALSATETDPVLELTEVALGEDDPTLSATVPNESSAPPAEAEQAPQPVLWACRSGSTWSSTRAGAWDDKPEVDCDAGSVEGQRSSDGKTWTFALGQLQFGRVVNVVLVPGTVEGLPEGSNGSTFEIAFAPPNDATLATTETPPAATDGESFPQGQSGSGAADLPSTPPPNGLALSPPPADIPPLDLAPGGGVGPELPEADQGVKETAPLVPSRNVSPPSTDPAEGSDTARVFAAIALLGGAGLALLAGRQRPRPVRSLSRFVPVGPQAN